MDTIHLLDGWPDLDLMSACTMMLCWSLRYFLWPPVTGPVTGPTSLLSLVRTRWPCTSWRERTRSQQVTFILLTHCSSSPPSSPRGCLSVVHGVRRMKSSRCLYFNEISQTNHQHQQSDIKNSSADHLGIISRLPNVSDGDLEIFSSVQSDELTE